MLSLSVSSIQHYFGRWVKWLYTKHIVEMTLILGAAGILGRPIYWFIDGSIDVSRSPPILHQDDVSLSSGLWNSVVTQVH